MRVTVASGRGLLSGWLIAATIPLLIDPHTIAAWSAAGVGDRWRLGLAAIELLGAVLFAFELPAVVGFALLLASFALAAVIHISRDETPWWLAVYLIAGILLLYCTRRARPQAAIA
jgi:hypothetical protein